MQKILAGLLIAVVSIVGWQSFQKYKQQILDKLQIPSNAPQGTAAQPAAGSPPNSAPYPNGQQAPPVGYGAWPAGANGPPPGAPDPRQWPQNGTSIGPGYSGQYPPPYYGNPPPNGSQTANYPPFPPGPTTSQPLAGPPQNLHATIKIASFNIQVFGEKKLANRAAMGVIVELLRRYDVVAIQEVRAVSDEILPRFIAELNATGRGYDYVIGPRLGRTTSKEQYAFVFDQATVEIDRAASYTVQDPGDRLHREPLVACFRTRGAPPQQAFTFTLINIHTDPDEFKSEVDALADVVRAVRNDGRGEDDVLLLGDLNASEKQLGQLGRVPDYQPLVMGVPTNTRGSKTYDNLIYPRSATVEFTGQWGVTDFARDYQLSEAQALEVSDHRPIWGEFSVYEGGPGRLAQQPNGGMPAPR